MLQSLESIPEVERQEALNDKREDSLWHLVGGLDWLSQIVEAAQLDGDGRLRPHTEAKEEALRLLRVRSRRSSSVEQAVSTPRAMRASSRRSSSGDALAEGSISARRHKSHGNFSHLGVNAV